MWRKDFLRYFHGQMWGNRTWKRGEGWGGRSNVRASSLILVAVVGQKLDMVCNGLKNEALIKFNVYGLCGFTNDSTAVTAINAMKDSDTIAKTKVSKICGILRSSE